MAFYSGLVIDCDTTMSALNVNDDGDKDFERASYLLGLASSKVSNDEFNFRLYMCILLKIE